MSSQTLTFTQSVNAPPAGVYHALTNATALGEWLCDDARANAREGGYFFLGWNSGYYASGTFTALQSNQSLTFTWQGKGEPSPTRVHVSLEERVGGTLLTLTHDEIGSGEAWDEIVKEIRKGWATGLENLASVLETGVDLRIARRPMFGIVGGEEMTDELASKLGLPASEGVRIDGTVPGMGAEAAGIQKDDVVVNLGGQPVTNFQTLLTALSAHQAGDTVEVIFYRAGQKQSVKMELSRRPTPDVPPTAAGLAEAVKEIYDQNDEELAALFDGVTETEAAHQPAPDEWSAKQTLGHLIVSERETQTQITSLVIGNELNVFTGNHILQVDSVVAAFPTVAGLLEELKRAELQTVSMLAALPEEFVARKGSYMRMGTGLLTAPYHLEAHAGQIKAAIAAAQAG